jgi:hypothetical protein
MGDLFTKHHSPTDHKCTRAYNLYYKHSPMIIHDTRLEILRGCVDIPPSSWPDRALSALNYGPEPSCNLSRKSHRHKPITCAHTTCYSITPLIHMIHRNLNRSMHTQECNHAYTHVYGHLNAPHMHLNGPYRHSNVLVLASPVRPNN